MAMFFLSIVFRLHTALGAEAAHSKKRRGKKHNVFVIRSWFFHAWPDSIDPIAGVNNKSLMDSALCESLMLLLHPSYALHTNHHEKERELPLSLW